MCSECYDIDDAPVGTDYQTFRDFVRGRLAGVLQSRTELRDSEGQPRRDASGDVVRARREITLTQGTTPGRPHASLHDVWVAINSVRNPPLQQGRMQVHFHPSRRPSARSLSFTTLHRPRPVPPGPPPRGVRVIREMRRTMRELGMRCRTGRTFAYWFCQQYAHEMPTIQRDRNPPMIAHLSPISGMPQYGGLVYNVCFASLSGWWWDEMQTYHAYEHAGINGTHFIGRQREGLQDVINYWAIGFTERARSTAGEAALQFMTSEEYGIFREVMRTRPPEVTVTREMVRRGNIGTCDQWDVLQGENDVPIPAFNHVRCPCCPARMHQDPGGFEESGCSPTAGIMQFDRR